ncbi:hypothetical protein ARMGADRAFT_1016181 [Armillaria gallica]|uniref:Uncharacterized protein n=1 Tax=Armillaria gallica TaxID=47427 RepID=A0A2H3DIS9_ARMGA|nr:hypothetical protein ARMGADRAFT_1016181 [Armillaria gallica]
MRLLPLPLGFPPSDFLAFLPHGTMLYCATDNDSFVHLHAEDPDCLWCFPPSTMIKQANPNY